MDATVSSTPATAATTTTATATAPTSWYRSLRVGDPLDVLDADDMWREATVKSISETCVRVHCHGRASNTNEYVPLGSARLAPAYTKVANWRAFTKRQRVQVGTIAYKLRKPAWRNAVVLTVAASPDGIKLEHDALTTRTAAATSSSSTTRFRVRVKLDRDGETRWMDAQSEFLSPPNTHSTFNTATTLELSEDEDDDDVEDKAENGDSTATGEPGSSLDDDSTKEPWRVALNEGAAVEVADLSSGSEVWYEARVADRCLNKICVRFRGWPWIFDEWLPITSKRLAQHETHLGTWRRTVQTGQFVQIGFRVAEHSDMASHWVTGTIVNRSHRKASKALARVKIKFTDRESGTCKSEWREIDDNFLAPLNVPTFPLPRKRKPQTSDEETKPEPQPQPQPRSSRIGNSGRSVTPMTQPQPVREDTPAAVAAAPPQADEPMPARLVHELLNHQRNILKLRGRFEQLVTSCAISLDDLQEQAEAIVTSLPSHQEADFRSVPRPEPEPEGRPKRKIKRTKRG